MGRLHIVSNRLPVRVARENGNIELHRSVGGVATGLNSLATPLETRWIGWTGIASDDLTPEDRVRVDEALAEISCTAVHLSREEVQQYYLGFCNETIWPLFHYFPLYCQFDRDSWHAYQRANEVFYEQLRAHYQPGDLIWIHDYQLMLLPEIIRRDFPDAAIGFFLHIPFPSFELLRLLPWRQEILDGLLGADLVGFHEYDYVRHFLSSAARILGHQHNLSHIHHNDRIIRVDAFPMGINYEQFATCTDDPEVVSEIEKLQDQVAQGRRLVISVDRLDYTKGIVNRLEIFEQFLARYPEYRGNVTLVVVAVPSRDEVEKYVELRDQLEQLIGRINGTYSTIDWTPIAYLYRALSFRELAALYVVASVALITPLRDGMNLVAKEFVATNSNLEDQGVLILSEVAGAANELSEAIIVNPNNKREVVEALRTALEMPAEQRRQKNTMMQERLSRYTVAQWASDFLGSLGKIKLVQEDLAMKHLSDEDARRLVDEYGRAHHRLFLLDYDGTLVDFHNDPEAASPDEHLLGIIETLASDPNNEVVIISGRDKHTLGKWLGNLRVNMVAEHGAFICHDGSSWLAHESLPQEWKATIRPIIERFVDRTPRSWVEEKTHSLVWHCRRCDPDLAKLRTHELKDALMAFTKNMEIGVHEGAKIIEVKNLGINKGAAAENWLSGRSWDFIFAAGDDYTDEDMFSVLPDSAYSFKLGQGASAAKYLLERPGRLLDLLGELARLTLTSSETTEQEPG